jgi:hypothetical protein
MSDMIVKVFNNFYRVLISAVITEGSTRCAAGARNLCMIRPIRGLQCT